MAKIPFNIKFRPQIESGEYKVICKLGPVDIIHWDRKDDTCNRNIVGLIHNGSVEEVVCWRSDGTYSDFIAGRNTDYDLFLVTPEPELSEFEQRIEDLLELADGEGHGGPDIKHTKRVANEYLGYALKELVRQGYVIEKKVFHDAVDKVEPKVMKEVSENVDAINNAYERGKADALKNIPNDEDMKAMLMLEYDKGRFDVLKDLPMWRTIEDATEKRTDENDCVTTEKMLIKGLMDQDDYMILPPDCMVNRKIMCIPVRELKKLPGLKEDSHE